MYKAPLIESGRGIAAKLAELPAPVLVCTMDIPWRLLREDLNWTPSHVHFVTDMDLQTVENLDRTLPQAKTIVGIGGGSCCDTAKFLAWKRGCSMTLAPTIVSVDAPLTNQVAVRIENKVSYIGDIWPERILIDHSLIQKAPPELNRAGAADIVSIHTALYDWALARDNNDEPWDPTVAQEARECLQELDHYADEVRNVTAKGIDTIVELYRREVEFCARIGASRPEEGSEHLVAYNIERVTRRHFVHGDLVALGVFVMSRLQDNAHEWAVALLDQLGLRYRVPNLAPDELKTALATLGDYIRAEKTFYSILNARPVTTAFAETAIQDLYRG